MRFLSVNHLRLGSSSVGIPADLSPDARIFSARSVWHRAVDLAIREQVHAVLLTGNIFSPTNPSLEPWGPLVDGLAQLQQAEIPVVAIEQGEFTASNLTRFTSADAVHWLDDVLEWDPIFTTDSTLVDGSAVHIVAASLVETTDTPAENPITTEQMNHPDSIWLLTDPLQPDQMAIENALIIEPGSASALSSHETGRHGAWLIDTETRDAELHPLVSIEFASTDIDISAADDLDTLERDITSGLVKLVDTARVDDSIADLMLADVTLSGSSRLYPALAATANELQRMLRIEHDGMVIAMTKVAIDATPAIELEPLLKRPDPVGEVARLLAALQTGSNLNDAQSRLLTAAEQKLLAISHARVFGSILDMEPDTDATTLLRRQGWATLDALVRQRGID